MSAADKLRDEVRLYKDQRDEALEAASALTVERDRAVGESAVLRDALVQAHHLQNAQLTTPVAREHRVKVQALVEAALAASPLAASAGAVLAKAVELIAARNAYWQAGKADGFEKFRLAQAAGNELGDAVHALLTEAAGEPHTPMVGSNSTSAARGVGEPAG